jgi:site-specific recombinase XerD
VARLHLLAEFFATMTGRGVEITDGAGNTDRMVFMQNQCACWLRSFANRLEFVELTKDEALTGLDKAQRLGVQGARVYDYWHALVSNKAKSNELITRNTRDFQGLAENVAWP